MRALPLFVFISLKHMCVKGIYKGKTTKHSHMGQGGGGGAWAVSIQSYPLLTEKTKTPIVVNE